MAYYWIRFKRRIKQVLAALRYPMHAHTCACGQTFYCQSGLCKDQLCDRCEVERFEGWVAELEATGRPLW